MSLDFSDCSVLEGLYLCVWKVKSEKCGRVGSEGGVECRVSLRCVEGVAEAADLANAQSGAGAGS